MTNRKRKFTAPICNKLAGPVDGGKAIEWTDSTLPGLKLSVSASGIKTWYFRYSFEGEKNAIRIGKYPGISVDEARKIARDFGAQLDRSINPKQLRAEKDEIPNFKDFALATYMPHATERKRSFSDDESKLRLHLVPVFGSQKLTNITRYDIETYLTKIRKSHSPATSNRHQALLSRMFNLAIGWGLMEKNPCEHVGKFAEPIGVGKDFTQAEIQAIIKALSTEANQKAATALKLLMFSGLRKREILDARWENVDLDAGRLFLPTTKAGKPRQVALNTVAIEILKNIPHIDDSPWVFPGEDTSKPINTIQKAWKRVLASAGVGDARIHDLRHQFATSAASGGVSMPNLMGLLGHSNVKTTLRYAHHTDEALRNASQQAASNLLGQ